MHVKISAGSQESLTAAEQRISDIFHNADLARRLSQTVVSLPKEASSIKSTVGDIIDESVVGMSVTETIQVPVPLLPMILGRGMEHIKSVERLFSVRVIVEKDNAANASLPVRDITIRGREEMVQKTKEIIQTVVQTGDVSVIRSIQTSHDGYEVVSIPQSQVGLVVGRRGDTIKQLQSRTGTTINVAKMDDEKNPGMRNITITGPVENVKEAKRQVIEIANVGSSNE